MTDIPLHLIDPDPEQPRKHFDPAALDELAQSMKADGLAVAILLRPIGDRFMIVHGERRWRAAQQLGWETIPADVRDLTDDQARWLAFAENMQRADLSPIEEAHFLHGRLTEGITQAELGKRIGKSQQYIAARLSLLNLAAPVQDLITIRMVNASVGVLLGAVKDEGAQTALAATTAAQDLSVADVRKLLDTHAELPDTFKPFLENGVLTNDHLRALMHLRDVFGDDLMHHIPVDQAEDFRVLGVEGWTILWSGFVWLIRPMEFPLMSYQDLTGYPGDNPDTEGISEADWLRIQTRILTIAEASLRLYSTAFEQGGAIPQWQAAALWWAVYAAITQRRAETLERYLDTFCISPFYSALIAAEVFIEAHKHRRPAIQSVLKHLQTRPEKPFTNTSHSNIWDWRFYGYGLDLKRCQAMHLVGDPEWARKAEKEDRGGVNKLAAPSLDWGYLWDAMMDDLGAESETDWLNARQTFIMQHLENIGEEHVAS